MITDRVEGAWVAAFERLFALSRIAPGDEVAVLSETQSRPLTRHLAELALARVGARAFHIVVPTPPPTAPVPVRSTGASQAIRHQRPVIAALTACPVVVDVTVEGLMHAPELPEILASGTRVLTISNEHPEALARLVPTEELKRETLAAARLAKRARRMVVRSAAGTDLTVAMEGARVVPVYGFADRPGTLSHVPGGLVVCFPPAHAVNGTLVLDVGDVNLTFKRYLASPVTLTIADDYVVDVKGSGTDYELFFRYLTAWEDREASGVSHVGWGLNRAARYESLTMYDQRDTNGTELRAFAGNFMYSTGANEFVGRYTQGHFDLPMRGCDLWLDDQLVIKGGVLAGDEPRKLPS